MPNLIGINPRHSYAGNSCWLNHKKCGVGFHNCLRRTVGIGGVAAESARLCTIPSRACCGYGLFLYQTFHRILSLLVGDFPLYFTCRCLDCDPGSFALPPIILCFVVLLWTAGFDIIYACQDVNFDRKHGLRSIPAKLGIRWALWLSAVLHVLAVLLLLYIPFLVELGTFYYVGVGIVVLIFIYEHAIVKPTDLSRVNLAFFTLNGMISLVLMALSIADILL